MAVGSCVGGAERGRCPRIVSRRKEKRGLFPSQGMALSIVQLAH